MYTGAYRCGEEITFRPHALSAAGEPLVPPEAPVATVYDAAGAKVRSGLLVPSCGYPRTRGHFELRLRLDEDFVPGRHCVLATWQAGGQPQAAVWVFCVLEGGHGSGTVTSLWSHPRPAANYLVQGRDSGRIYKGKNPRA